MSYQLDPSLKKPAGEAKSGEGTNKERDGAAKKLLDLFDLEDERIKKVRLRKVVVEIEFEDDCC